MAWSRGKFPYIYLKMLKYMYVATKKSSTTMTQNEKETWKIAQLFYSNLEQTSFH